MCFFCFINEHNLLDSLKIKKNRNKQNEEYHININYLKDFSNNCNNCKANIVTKWNDTIERKLEKLRNENTSTIKIK